MEAKQEIQLVSVNSFPSSTSPPPSILFLNMHTINSINVFAITFGNTILILKDKKILVTSGT